jgi:trehalose/maltose hydrolase-like predicted phosphorylase
MPNAKAEMNWRVSETYFDPSCQHHHETIFTQGNGYLGTRGILEEGYPLDMNTTLVHGFWDDAPIVMETAVFWGERVEPQGKQFAIRNVIGPDEYHDHVDNNAFTNPMVQWHLSTALNAYAWLEEHAPTKAAILRDQLELTPQRLGGL